MDSDQHLIVPDDRFVDVFEPRTSGEPYLDRTIALMLFSSSVEGLVGE